MKRFYEQAAILVADGGIAVTLDGKPVKTPARRPLVLPNERLAKAVADEWADQDETITPHTMPIMGLAATAIDRVTDRRDAVVDEIAAYGETDLLCYRACEPADLKARQEEAWQPLLDWCAQRYGARLAVTEGVVAVAQDRTALASMRTAVDGYDAFSLAALHAVTSTTGSLVIALALAAGKIDTRETWLLSRVDERFQVERWGMDETAEDDAERLRTTLFAAARFLSLCNHCKIDG